MAKQNHSADVSPKVKVILALPPNPRYGHATHRMSDGTEIMLHHDAVTEINSAHLEELRKAESYLKILED